MQRALPLVAGALGALWLVLTTAGSFFTSDDHVFFAQARETAFGWDFLSAPIYDHFSPWHRLLDHVVVETTDQGWWLALAISLVWYGAALALFTVLIRRLVGTHPAGLVAIVLFALSPIFVQATQWWALGAQLFPQLVFTFATVLCALRWTETRRVLWAAAAAAAYALALCGFIKALLALPLVALVLYLRPGAEIRVRRDLPLWAGLGVVTVVYALIISGDRYYRFIGDLPDPSASLWAKYLAAAWGEGVAPLVLDGTVPPTLGVGNVLVLVVTNLAVLAAIALAVRTAPRTWLVWAGALAIVLAGMLMSGRARVTEIGVETAALEVRYNAEGAIALLIAAAVAGRAAWPSARRGWAAVALAAVCTGLAVDAGLRLEDGWIGPVHRDYFAAFEDSYDGTLDIVDQTAPNNIVPVVIVPWNLVSEVLPEREPQVRVGTGDGTPATITPAGEVVPVELEPVEAAGAGCGPRTVDVGATGAEDVVVLTLTRTGSLDAVTSGIVADSGVPAGPVVRGFRLPPTTTTPLRIAAGQRVKRVAVGYGPVKAVALPAGVCGTADFTRFPLP